MGCFSEVSVTDSHELAGKPSFHPESPEQQLVARAIMRLKNGQEAGPWEFFYQETARCWAAFERARKPV
jgi:hypothetical protein